MVEIRGSSALPSQCHWINLFITDLIICPSLAKPMNGFQNIMTSNGKELLTNPLESFFPHIRIHIYFYVKVTIKWSFKNIWWSISNIEIIISILCSRETVLKSDILDNTNISFMLFLTLYTLAMNLLTDNTHILLVFSISCRKYKHRLHISILDWWQLYIYSIMFYHLISCFRYKSFLP